MQPNAFLKSLMYPSSTSINFLQTFYLIQTKANFWDLQHLQKSLLLLKQLVQRLEEWILANLQLHLCSAQSQTHILLNWHSWSLSTHVTYSQHSFYFQQTHLWHYARAIHHIPHFLFLLQLHNPSSRIHRSAHWPASQPWEMVYFGLHILHCHIVSQVSAWRPWVHYFILGCSCLVPFGWSYEAFVDVSGCQWTIERQNWSITRLRYRIPCFCYWNKQFKNNYKPNKFENCSC